MRQYRARRADKSGVDGRVDRTRRPDAPFGSVRAAGNRAIAALLARAVQRDDDSDAQVYAGDLDSSSAVDDVCQAIRDNVDGAAVADAWRRDAAAQDQGSGGPAVAGDGSSVQTLGEGFVAQRDTPPPAPAPPKSGDLSDLADAILKLKAISDLLDRLADLAAKQVKKAGAPLTVVLGSVTLPALLVGLSQGAGVTKLNLKTPEISLGQDGQGVKRTIKLGLDATYDPKRGGGASISAEIRF